MHILLCSRVVMYFMILALVFRCISVGFDHDPSLFVLPGLVSSSFLVVYARQGHLFGHFFLHSIIENFYYHDYSRFSCFYCLELIVNDFLGPAATPQPTFPFLSLLLGLL